MSPRAWWSPRRVRRLFRMPAWALLIVALLAIVYVASSSLIPGIRGASMRRHQLATEEKAGGEALFATQDNGEFAFGTCRQQTSRITKMPY